MIVIRSAIVNVIEVKIETVRVIVIVVIRDARLASVLVNEIGTMRGLVAAGTGPNGVKREEGMTKAKLSSLRSRRRLSIRDWPRKLNDAIASHHRRLKITLLKVQRQPVKQPSVELMNVVTIIAIAIHRVQSFPSQNLTLRHQRWWHPHRQ